MKGEWYTPIACSIPPPKLPAGHDESQDSGSAFLCVLCVSVVTHAMPFPASLP